MQTSALCDGNGGQSPVGDRLSAGEFSVQLHVDEHALRSGQAWIFRDCDRKRIVQTAAGYARIHGFYRP